MPRSLDHASATNRALGTLVLTGVLAAAVLDRFEAAAFSPYFGSRDPALATLLALTLGALSLVLLDRRGWFAIWRGDLRGLRPAAKWAAAFAVPVILVDLLGGFGPDINVPPPGSLLFYPLMAVVAESAFHLVPLGAMAGLAVLIGGEAKRVRPAALSLACVIEPALQLAWGSASSPAWANAYVGAHVLAINVVGLSLFHRYDFVSMYGFRFVYYLLWHIGWGALRLGFLFGV